jgi:hypothetical protein
LEKILFFANSGYFSEGPSKITEGGIPVWIFPWIAKRFLYSAYMVLASALFIIIVQKIKTEPTTKKRVKIGGFGGWGGPRTPPPRGF